MIYGILALIGGLISLVLPETLNKTLPESIEDGERFGRYVTSDITFYHYLSLD